MRDFTASLFWLGWPETIENMRVAPREGRGAAPDDGWCPCAGRPVRAWLPVALASLHPLSHSVLASQMVEQDDILRDNKELLNRYVAKYFNKYKYEM